MAQGGRGSEYAGDHVGEIELLAWHLGEHGEEAHGEAGDGARVREVLFDPRGELVEHLGRISIWHGNVSATHLVVVGLDAVGVDGELEEHGGGFCKQCRGDGLKEAEVKPEALDAAGGAGSGETCDGRGVGGGVAGGDGVDGTAGDEGGDKGERRPEDLEGGDECAGDLGAVGAEGGDGEAAEGGLAGEEGEEVGVEAECAGEDAQAEGAVGGQYPGGGRADVEHERDEEREMGERVGDEAEEHVDVVLDHERAHAPGKRGVGAELEADAQDVALRRAQIAVERVDGERADRAADARAGSEVVWAHTAEDDLEHVERDGHRGTTRFVWRRVRCQTGLHLQRRAACRRMALQFNQAAQEGIYLRFPDNITPQRELSYENAISMLLRGAVMAQNVPFTWAYIDKPMDGSLFLLFHPQNVPFAIDGLRFQDSETKYPIPAGARVSTLPILVLTLLTTTPGARSRGDKVRLHPRRRRARRLPCSSPLPPHQGREPPAYARALHPRAAHACVLCHRSSPHLTPHTSRHPTCDEHPRAPRTHAAHQRARDVRRR